MEELVVIWLHPPIQPKRAKAGHTMGGSEEKEGSHQFHNVGAIKVSAKAP